MENLLEVPGFRRRAGRRFEPVAERSLDQELRSLARRLPGAENGVRVIPEFGGPNGIADLIAVTRFEPGLKRRLASGIRLISSPIEATIVSAVPFSRTVTLQSLSKRLGISEKQLAVVVRRLEGSAILVRSGGGYRRSNAVAPIGRMYALEAKVSDWRRAMTQAVRYATWSDAVGVVLLSPPRDTTGAVSRAKALNVGLSIGGRWFVRPKIRPSHPGRRLLASEFFVEAFTRLADSDYQSPSADA